MITTLADPWLAQNAGRRYPLADDSGGLDGEDSGRPVNRDNAILDFRCSVTGVANGAAPTAAVGSIYDDGSVRVVEVDVSLGGGRSETLRFEIPRDLAPSGHASFSAASGHAFGTLTVTAAVMNVDARRFGTAFAASTVVADSLCVDSIVGMPHVSYDADDRHHIDSPDTVLEPADDGRPVDVVLDAGANADPYLDGNRLRLEIAKGYGRGEWCQRQEAIQNCGNVLFSVNGERPGSDGSLNIVGDGGIVVTPDREGHALVITVDRPAVDMLASDCRTQCQGGSDEIR